MHFKRLSLIFVASAIGVIAASSSSTSLTLDQLDLNSTTIEDEVEALEDPTTLDPAYGKDFNQTIQSEAGVNDVCTTKVCTQAGVPLRKNQRFRLRLESKCGGSILNTDLYMKGLETCTFFVNPHWHTDKNQNQPRVYWYLTQGGTTGTSDILTNTPTIMVSDRDKTCYDAPARDPDTALADAIIAVINAIKGGGVISDYFFYSMSTSHGAHGVDVHRLRAVNKPKLISFEYVMKRNGKYLYNVISSEFGRRKFLFFCSGDDTQWTNNFADDTYMEFRTD